MFQLPFISPPVNSHLWGNFRLQWLTGQAADRYYAARRPCSYRKRTRSDTGAAENRVVIYGTDIRTQQFRILRTKMIEPLPVGNGPNPKEQ